MLRAAKKFSENTPAKFVHTDSRVMGKFLRYDKLKDTWSSCKFDDFWRQPLYTVIDNADEYAAATQHSGFHLRLLTLLRSLSSTFCPG